MATLITPGVSPALVDSPVGSGTYTTPATVQTSSWKDATLGVAGSYAELDSITVGPGRFVIHGLAISDAASYVTTTTLSKTSASSTSDWPTTTVEPNPSSLYQFFILSVVVNLTASTTIYFNGTSTEGMAKRCYILTWADQIG